MRSEGILRTMILVLLLSLPACTHNRQEEEKRPSRRKVSEETLVNTNRYLVEKDEERIRRFIERHGWKMTKTGTGLWYQIYEHGHGPKVTEGKKVTINYTVRLLDGSVCYSSEKSGPRTFTAGHGTMEAGLEQGILMMRQGDKARLILPPFLAWGVPGDRNKIPPRSVIVYELEVIKVE